MLEKKSTICLSCIVLLLTSFTFIFSSGKLPADDGFFYLEVAKNVADGNGLHFNSLYNTNGFHPLWGLICILVAVINPFGHEYLIYIIWIIQVFLFYKSITYFKNYWNHKIIHLIPLVILVIVFCSLGTIYLSEAFINFFSLALIFRFLNNDKQQPFITGIIFSIIFLSRLDNVFILFFLGIYICFIQQRFSFKYFVLLTLGFSLLVFPYLIFNQLEFGSIVPVSGKIKSFFPSFEMKGFNHYTKILLLTTILYLISLVSILKGRNFRNLLLFFTLGTLVQLLYNGIFQSQIGQWYFVAQFIVLAFLCYDMFIILSERVTIPNKYKLALIVGFIICLSISIFKLSNGFTLSRLNKIEKISLEFKSPIEYFVDDLKATLPSDARIYVYDTPGRIAYYSNFDVIPADGLINNKQFSDDLNKGTFEDYLMNNNIDYVLLPSDSKPTFPLTHFLAINTEIINGKQRFEIKDPYQKKVLYEMDMSKYKEIMSVPNPLMTWQPHYDLVKIFQLIK